MALEICIEGPGVHEMRLLQPGGPELVLGRDADCGVCLPDPLRNVSRRHLAVWNKADELHFHVLSVINGVEMPFGEAPPGARGVLPAGQVLKLAEYNVTVAPALARSDDETDPWAVFDREDSDRREQTLPSKAAAQFGQTGSFLPEDDPFGDWGFETTFGPDGDGNGPLDAAQLGAGDLSAFFRGLGLDRSRLGALSTGELEAIGRLVRKAVLGLLEVHGTSIGAPQQLSADDRTIVATSLNPLKSDWTDEIKLRYLFGGRPTTAGFIKPDRAVTEIVEELLAHHVAVGAATRATIESTLREFSPTELKEKLLGAGSKLFESARAWDAYARYYEEQGQIVPPWAQRLADKYFSDAYLRESLRIKGETGGGQR